LNEYRILYLRMGRKARIVVGKVIVAKAIGIDI
jgi:hypothetical protein